MTIENRDAIESAQQYLRDCTAIDSLKLAHRQAFSDYVDALAAYALAQDSYRDSLDDAALDAARETFATARRFWIAASPSALIVEEGRK